MSKQQLQIGFCHSLGGGYGGSERKIYVMRSAYKSIGVALNTVAKPGFRTNRDGEIQRCVRESRLLPFEEHKLYMPCHIML